MKPLDLLKHAGVDMSTDQPIRQAVAYVGTLVDELENCMIQKKTGLINSRSSFMRLQTAELRIAFHSDP